METELLRQYNKSELLDLCIELDITADSTTHSKKMLAAIISNLEVEGVPEDDDCSELLWNFLVDAGFLSEEGELLERDVKVVEQVPATIAYEAVPDDVEIAQKPPCYTFADLRAPECGRCKLFKACMAERERIRLTIPCFGKLFDISNEECKHCLEAGPCRIACQQV